jgi:hypothetical protein
MAWWRIWNMSDVPICISVGSVGVARYCTNNLAVGGYWEADVTGWLWCELYVVRFGAGPAGHDVTFKVGERINNGLPPADHLEIGGRVVASVPSQDASSLAPWIAASAETLAQVRDWAHARQKQEVTVDDCHYTPGPNTAWIGPLFVTNIFAPDGYNIYIRGATLSSGLTCAPGEDPRLIGFMCTPLYADAMNNPQNPADWQSELRPG